MGDNVKIDTAGVEAIATAIGKINLTMKDDFQKVDNAFGQLLRGWHSDAAGRTNESYNWMKNSFVEPRFEVIDLQKGILDQRIFPGYDSVEMQNIIAGESMQQF